MSIGSDIRSLDTPILWVDLDLMEKNIDYLANYFQKAGISWRPHFKGLKVPAVANMMLNAGAVGITCAKLSEAEVLVASGIEDLFIANQIVGPIKIKRLVDLRKLTDVMVSVDSYANVEEISSSAVAAGVLIRILIEINTGINRCGVEPGKPVVELANQVTDLPGLEFAGIMTWEGGRIAKIADLVEKEKQCRMILQPFIESAQLCRQSGLEVQIVICGGSGTFMVSSHIPGITDIKAGGAVFGSVAYREWGVGLDIALHVTSTVISRPSATRAVVDAGQKAMSCSVAFPEPSNLPGVKISALHSEHGILEIENPDVAVNYGDKVDFLVGYGDFTVNLFDHIYGVRNEIVEVVWDVLARGKLT